MKFCQSHWEELKNAIRERGLWELVAHNGHAAVYRMKQELEGTATDSTYDPLMAAHMMICGQALKMGGLYLMTGDYCPLCELEKHAPESGNLAAEWIKGSTEAVLDYCRDRGLISSPGMSSI